VRAREGEETYAGEESKKKTFALQEDHLDGPQLDSIIWVLFTLVSGPSDRLTDRRSELIY
jgi:hypothetical protein